MEGIVTVTAKRTFSRSFVIALQLWFATASGYISTAVLAVIMAYAFYDESHPWIAIASGLAWVAFMMPIAMAMQAWRIVRWSRSLGDPVFSFDSESVTCKSGEMVTRIPWSGIKRIKLTGKTCFIYVTERAAWFFAREEMGVQGEAALLDFARRSNVKLIGLNAA